MAVFAYKGIDASGRNVKGVRDAESPRALRNVLKRDGVMVTEVLEHDEAAKKSAREIDLKRFFRLEKWSRQLRRAMGKGPGQNIRGMRKPDRQRAIRFFIPAKKGNG